MHKIIIDLIKAIWPFLRESWFQGDSINQWIKKHKTITMWLGLILALAGSELISLRELNEKKLMNLTLHEEITQLNNRILTLETENRALNKSLSVSEENLKNLKEVKQNYDLTADWLQHCNLTDEMEADICPTQRTQQRTPVAPIRAAQARARHTKVTPQQRSPQKETFRQKLRRIFGRSENRS